MWTTLLPATLIEPSIRGLSLGWYLKIAFHKITKLKNNDKNNMKIERKNSEIITHYGNTIIILKNFNSNRIETINV